MNIEVRSGVCFVVGSQPECYETADWKPQVALLPPGILVALLRNKLGAEATCRLEALNFNGEQLEELRRQGGPIALRKELSLSLKEADRLIKILKQPNELMLSK